MSKYKILVLAGSILAAACSGEDLSIGELRCVNVECEPRPLQDMTWDVVEAEVVMHDEPAVIDPQLFPCPRGACFFLRARLAHVENEDESETLVAANYVTESEEDERPVNHGIWLGRYRDNVLMWDEDVVNWRYIPFRGGYIAEEAAIALVESENLTSVLLVVTRYRRSDGDNLEELTRQGTFDLSVYAVEGDDVRLAFEAESTGGYVHQAARMGDDVLLATEGDDGHVEVSRYTLDGELKWRQAMLDFGDEFVISSGSPNASLQMVKLGGDRVAVLVKRMHNHQVAVIDRDGAVVWSSFAPLSRDPTVAYFGARLAASADGELFIGTDGYEIARIDSFEENEGTVVERERREYYEAAVFGLDVDGEGAVFVATHDGDADSRRLLLDRYAPDFSERETVSVEYAEGSRHGCYGLFEARMTLRVSEDGHELALLGDSCFVQLGWPSIPPRSIGDGDGD